MRKVLQELEEENERLKEEIEKLKQEKQHYLEEYELLLEEWDKLLNDKVLYSSLLQKYKKVIDILKKELNFNFIDYQQRIIIDDSISFDLLNMSLGKEEYDLLKEVFGNE